MSLGLLRHARVFIVDPKDRILSWEERPLWILGRPGRRRISWGRIYVHLERVQTYRDMPVEGGREEFVWIRVRDEEPLLFMRTYADAFVQESLYPWAEQLADDLECPLTERS